MKHFISILLLIFVLSLSSNSMASCVTNGCHAERGQKQFVHAPVAEGECVSCHQQQSQSHPSGNKADFSVISQRSSLCFDCHDNEEFVRKYSHGPSASGACLVCHNPHESDLKGLLNRPIQNMCLGCHSDFAKSMAEAKFIHSAIQELDCSSCHMPHSSDQPKLLKQKGTDLCFDCHENIKSKYDSSLSKHKALYVEKRCGNCHLAHFSNNPSLLFKKDENLCYGCHGLDDSNRFAGLENIRKKIEGKEVVHGPVADGQCIACHDPHGSSFSNILIGPYPQSFYAPFKDDLYDFCFKCHDKELLTSQPAKNQTEFRNGTDNLHFRHVARAQKGRACRSCHSVHASNGQKLINPDGIPFGKWNIPIRFETTETGGSCMPGCHRRMEYGRDESFDNTEIQTEDQKEPYIKYSPSS